MIIVLVAAGMLGTVLIHLLDQRRRTPLAFGDTRFLVPVNMRQRRIQRLRQAPLLVLRLALLGLIAVWLNAPESAPSPIGAEGHWQSPRIAGNESVEPALLALHQEEPARARIANHWREGVTTAPILRDTRIEAVAVDPPRWQAEVGLMLPPDHPQRDRLASALAAIDASGAMNLVVCGAGCEAADIAFVADDGSDSGAHWQVQITPVEADWLVEPVAPDRYRLGLPATAGDAYAWRLQQLLHQLLSQREPPDRDATAVPTGDWQLLYPSLILLLWLIERLVAAGRRG